MEIHRLQEIERKKEEKKRRREKLLRIKKENVIQALCIYKKVKQSIYPISFCISFYRSPTLQTLPKWPLAKIGLNILSVIWLNLLNAKSF